MTYNERRFELAHFLRSRHEVQERQDGHKELLHPQVGLLVLEHSTFQIDGSPGLKMVVYLSVCEEIARKLEQLSLS